LSLNDEDEEQELDALAQSQLKDLDQMDSGFDRLLQMMLHARGRLNINKS
jgi:hypothetical protein